jgi:hypothetical protein
MISEYEANEKENHNITIVGLDIHKILKIPWLVLKDSEYREVRILLQKL